MRIPDGILIRYHEIALKGGNRSWFEDKLLNNVKKQIERTLKKTSWPAHPMVQDNSGSGETPPIVQRLHGRLLLHTPWNETVIDALQHTFGISSFSPIHQIETNKEAICTAVIQEFNSAVQSRGIPPHFRIHSRRTDKVFPETSVDLDRWLGSEILKIYPNLPVHLKDPALTIGVEIRKNHSFIWSEKIAGPGGMPVGTNGHLLCLISGGLDSPVAAIQLLKRGARVSFIHFDGAPFVGRDALEKTEALVRAVNRFQPDPSSLTVIPFGKIQEKMSLLIPPKLRTVLYRRMMIRISCALAKKYKLQTLITGDSLGQVASQTIENLVTIEKASSLPIFRPLIGWDKDDIIKAAHAWGTFEISVRPGMDCCTLFADKHPATQTTPEQIDKLESHLPISDWMTEALREISH